jgi:hypothetical protein
VKMRLDTRDVWPADVPIGTFDVRLTAVKDYPAATGHLAFVCPNGHRCGFFVGPQFVDRPTKDAFCIWGWDGNIEQPTITPSINCVSVDDEGKPAGGCGWHGFMRAGDMA